MLEQSALIVQMLSIVHEHLLRIPEGEVVRLPVHPAGAVLSLADQAGVHLRKLISGRCAPETIISVCTYENYLSVPKLLYSTSGKKEQRFYH